MLDPSQPTAKQELAGVQRLAWPCHAFLDVKWTSLSLVIASLAVAVSMRHRGRVKHRWTWLIGSGIGLAAAALVVVPYVHADPLATVDGDPVHVQADRLEIDLKSGRAVLSGNVRIRRGELNVSCARVEAAYDKAPAVRWAKATGGVRAKLREFEAEAAEAELALDRRQLALRGDVRLSRGGAWMRASEASVDLKTNKVTLQQVRGTIPVPAALPRPDASK